MDGKLGEVLRSARVTTSAGFYEVGLMDHRLRIAGGPDIVNPMATGAVGRNHISSLLGQTVVAIQIGFDPEGRYAVLPGDPLRPVALGTGGHGDLLLRDGGSRVNLGLDAVDAMTVGADGGTSYPLFGRNRVNTSLIFSKGLGMALSAGGGDVLP